MKANDAKKNSEVNEKQIRESDHLYNHFIQLIKKASNLGKFEIAKQSFSTDRFSSQLIEEVVERLQKDGYKVALSKHNAHDLINFMITW